MCDEHKHEIITLEENILKDNDTRAAENRSFFREKEILAVNITGSPGSGKTTFLEMLIPHLGKDNIAVIEGDLEGDIDSHRMESLGVRTVQINTKGACHLNAHLISRAIEKLDLNGTKYLFIENVGNLICPTFFDLGEDMRIIISSVPEGEDKPAKYPPMFVSGSMLVLTKIDLLPYIDFSSEKFRDHLSRINPKLPVFEVTSKKPETVIPVAKAIKKQSKEPR
ncbi:hydrogenase nickel incorporation protein HypB [bacterium]|nr:hydrogenase nickel incorporation protein HypB [bacterium]